MPRLVSEVHNVPITLPCLGYLSSGNRGLSPGVVYSVMSPKGNIVPYVPDGLPGEISWSHGLNGRVMPLGGCSRDSLSVEWSRRVLPPSYHSP